MGVLRALWWVREGVVKRLSEYFPCVTTSKAR
jgi:hypothetical protein